VWTYGKEWDRRMEKLEIVFHKLYCLRAAAGTMELEGSGHRWDAGK
jgi:hypothetical protein